MINCSFKFRQNAGEEYVNITNPTVPGRFSEIIGGNFQVEVAIDDVTCAPTSSRQYKPLEIEKYVDSASPIIYQAICKGTRFNEAVLTMYRYNQDRGEEEAYYEIKLENVTFTSQKELLSDLHRPSGKKPPSEMVYLVAEKVTKTFLDGCITHTDSYRDKETAVAA